MSEARVLNQHLDGVKASTEMADIATPLTYWRSARSWRARPHSAGELADHFPVSRPTMSAHFAVLQEAGLFEATKTGRTILYRLRISVLEEALLSFAHTLGWKITASERDDMARRRSTRQSAVRGAV
jgi:DNA-binding transcriptional ArsR family regulator